MAEELGRLLQRGLLEHSDLTACGAVIYARSTDRILFLLRSGEKHDSTWALPGGKIEPGETITDALSRELREELSWDRGDSKLMPLELFKSRDGRFEYHTFVCLVDEEFVPVLNEEHKGYCWCDTACFPKPLHPGLWSSWNNREIQKKLETIRAVLKVT
jgi:ADP-ribose pyrophosphatase YjhB (NUDIX family)